MRYLSSSPFVVGLLLLGTAFAIAPLFVTTGPVVVSGDPATDWSWSIEQPATWDFRIPVLAAVSEVALMVIAVARMRRTQSKPN
jgi:hypothetical protein